MNDAFLAVVAHADVDGVSESEAGTCELPKGASNQTDPHMQRDELRWKQEEQRRVARTADEDDAASSELSSLPSEASNQTYLRLLQRLRRRREEDRRGGGSFTMASSC